MFKTSGQLFLTTADPHLLYSHRGRQLYRLYHGSTYYWLKLQQLGLSPLSERAFLHELAMYRVLQHDAQAVCLPHIVLDLNQFSDAPTDVYPEALCVQDSQALFTQWSKPDFGWVLHRLIQSVHVLEQLHHVGFVHGDLKTAHFRLDQQHCYLIDFEQSIQIQAQHASTPSRPTATPRYMAPELFHGATKSIQSDIYALGVIWLQWLNQIRWGAKSYMDWAYWHCQLLQVELPVIFLVLKPILQRMLAKHRAQRYCCIEEIKRDMLKIV